MKNKKGITIVEILIVVALISVVSLLVFSLLLQSIININAVEDKNITQSDTRIVMDTIIERIRVSTQLVIMTTADDAESEIASGSTDHYLYLKEDTLYFYEYNGTDHDIFIIPFSNAHTGFLFTRVDSDTLQVSVKSALNASSFDSDVVLHLKNLSLQDPIQTITGTEGNAIKFLKP